MKTNKTKHTPVLLEKTIEFLNIKKGKKYIDTTVGGGGHAEAILREGGEVLGIDFDPKALEIARKRLTSACPLDVYCWRLAHGNFENLKEIAREHGFLQVSGILFDLGVSSDQIDKGERGFSFLKKGPLDMRVNPESQGVTAADLVNGLTKKELYEVITKYTGEKLAWSIASAIVGARGVEKITTTRQLSDLVEAVYKRKGWRDSRLHPATKVFLALRIQVNSEFENLKKGLSEAVGLLEPGGNLVVISFHSGEDGIVKGFIKRKQDEGILRSLTKGPIKPGEMEKLANPRSRSALLRGAQKT